MVSPKCEYFTKEYILVGAPDLFIFRRKEARDVRIEPSTTHQNPGTVVAREGTHQTQSSFERCL
jgi:hypothetical protein